MVTVGVVGLGYVGAVTATGMSILGHKVIGVDRDAYHISVLANGLWPEPTMVDYWYNCGQPPRLLKLVTADDGTSYLPLAECSVVFICVGTPLAVSGGVDVSAVEAACAQVAAVVPPETVIAIRSTVPPGTTDRLDRRYKQPVIHNPEFLREGSGLADFLDPSLVVFGGDLASALLVADVYPGRSGHWSQHCYRPNPHIYTDAKVSEFLKYACNAFHALKVAFANEMGCVAQSFGVSGPQVMQYLTQDRRLNTSAAYLAPGFCYSGPCLEKDLAALINMTGGRYPLLTTIPLSNDHHLRRTLDAVLRNNPRVVAILGLTFKPEAADVRDSAVVQLASELRTCVPVQIFEPWFEPDRWRLPRAIEKALCTTAADACKGASIVLVTRPFPETKADARFVELGALLY